MSSSEQQAQPRLLTPAEIGLCVRIFREMRQWSQEQLAEISGINVRTVQRIEQGTAASLDSRRALASAFEFEDLDLFSKPMSIPTAEELRAQKEQFDREHVTLTATPLTTGRMLAKLAEQHTMDMSEPAFELGREAQEKFAELVDYFRDYRDCAELYSESAKFEVYDALQACIDALKTLGVSLRYAERKIQMRFGTDASSQPMPASVLYVVAFPLGKEPEQFSTPKAAGIHL